MTAPRQGAIVIDAAGRFVVPAFIDTSVRLSPYGGLRDRCRRGLVGPHLRRVKAACGGVP